MKIFQKAILTRTLAAISLASGMALTGAFAQTPDANATGTASTAVAPVTEAAPPQPPVLKLKSLEAWNALSPAASEVLKLNASGVSEDVISAYVQNSGSPFNLSPDNIINLKTNNVPSTVLTAMINHDAQLRASAPVMPVLPPQVQQPPPQQTVAPMVDPNATVPPSDYSTYYNQLSPYGSWDYTAGYGWGWQPYASYGYGYYPSAYLGYGGWLYLGGGRGWRWSPYWRGGYGGYAYGPYHNGYGGFHSYAGVSFGNNGYHGYNGFHGNGTIAGRPAVGPLGGGSAHFSGGGGGFHGGTGFSGGHR